MADDQSSFVNSSVKSFKTCDTSSLMLLVEGDVTSKFLLLPPCEQLFSEKYMVDNSIAPQGNNMCCFISLVANACLGLVGFSEWLSLKKKILILRT